MIDLRFTYDFPLIFCLLTFGDLLILHAPSRLQNDAQCLRIILCIVCISDSFMFYLLRSDFVLIKIK